MTTPVSSKDEEAELWATNGQKFLQENEEALPIWAPALTLSSVFSSHNVTKVDFLSIDVEGGELDVLEGIDWGNIQIDLILIETQVNSPSIKLLKSLGYDHIVDLGQNHFLKSKNIM
jgi:FkbM family methyltransferase